MRKRLLPLLLFLALILPALPGAVGAKSVTVVLKIGCGQMSVNSVIQPVDEKSADVVPVAENGRTLVPVSRIVAAFGGSSSWDAATNATTFTLNGKTVTHTIGTDTVITPAGTRTMEVPSKAMNNRTYVPVRYVLEGLGLNVEYEAAEQLVVVSTHALYKKGLLELPEAKALLKALEDQSRNVLPESNHTAGTLLAPARTRAEMEPAHTDAVYVQDLGSATGFEIYLDSGTRHDSSFGYKCADGLSDEALLDRIRAYVDLLAAQPDFELVHPFGTDDGGISYVACLNYTGSRARMKGNVKSWFWDDRTTHVEVSVIMSKYSYASPGISVTLDENLKYADLGLRTATGAALLPPEQISGERVGDAYYEDKGTYYNASDKKLSTTPGKAALLIDGQSCGADAEFSAKGYITLTGYQRGEHITIFLPQDHDIAAGDVYGLDEMRYNLKNEKPLRIEITYNNGDEWAMATAKPDREIFASTLRVLRWEKAGQGNNVVYFHVKAELNGIAHEYEGLAAGPWTGAETKPSGSGSSGDKDCWYCGGSGTCPTCHGRGKVKKWVSGTTHSYVDQECTDCYSPGKCRMCGGKGH